MSYKEKIEPKKYWNPKYDEIVEASVVEKIVDVAKALDSEKEAHIFCQRAAEDLTGSIIRKTGSMDQETIDAINFAIRSGLSKQFKMTVAHYAVNYLQSKSSPSNYHIYLKNLFK